MYGNPLSWVCFVRKGRRRNLFIANALPGAGGHSPVVLLVGSVGLGRPCMLVLEESSAHGELVTPGV